MLEDIFEFIRKIGKQQEGGSGFLIPMQQLEYFYQGLLEGKKLVPVEEIYINGKLLVTNYVFADRETRL